MKALKKAEYNPIGAREHTSSDRESTPPFSGTPAQTANAFVPPPAPRPALLMSALLLGALVLGAAGIWFLLRPVPQPPIYLRQPPLPSSNNLPQQVTPQARILIPAENTRPISTEAPISELPATPESAPLPPLAVALTTAPVAVPKISARPLASPAPAAPIISPVEPDLLSAYQALQRGEYKTAEELYKNVRERQPKNIDALLGSAVIAAYDNQTEQALQLYTRVLELDTTNSVAQAGLIGLIGKSDFNLAETRLKELIAAKPAAHLYFALGNLYAHQGQWEQAQAAYFEAHHLQPMHADYSYNLAVALDQIRLPGPALQYYLKALSLSESKSNILFDRAKLNRRIAELKNTAP